MPALPTPNRNLPPHPQIWNLFLQAALGVQYLHRNHVLHR